MKMGLGTNDIIMCLLVALVLLSAMISTEVVFAQQQQQQIPPTTTTQGAAAPPLAELIAPHIGPGGEFVTPIVEQTQQACGATVPQICVDLVYASANIVVLTGEVLPELQVNRNFNNDFIWQAVEQIKAQGYSIQEVAITGAGTEGNPANYYIVMAKP